MKDRIFLALALTMVVAPTFAVPRISVPEPASISVFAIGAAGVFVARKLFGKK